MQPVKLAEHDLDLTSENKKPVEKPNKLAASLQKKTTAALTEFFNKGQTKTINYRQLAKILALPVIFSAANLIEGKWAQNNANTETAMIKSIYRATEYMLKTVDDLFQKEPPVKESRAMDVRLLSEADYQELINKQRFTLSADDVILENNHLQTTDEQHTVSCTDDTVSSIHPSLFGLILTQDHDLQEGIIGSAVPPINWPEVSVHLNGKQMDELSAALALQEALSSLQKAKTQIPGTIRLDVNGREVVTVTSTANLTRYDVGSAVSSRVRVASSGGKPILLPSESSYRKHTWAAPLYQ